MRNSIIRLYRALKNSLAGCHYLWMSQQAFRLEVYLAVVVLPFLYFLPLTPAKKIFLTLLFLLIFVVETINSAIEVIVDRISRDIHPLSKVAKDLGSTAVFFILIINFVAWLALLI